MPTDIFDHVAEPQTDIFDQVAQAKPASDIFDHVSPTDMANKELAKSGLGVSGMPKPPVPSELQAQRETPTTPASQSSPVPHAQEIADYLKTPAPNPFTPQIDLSSKYAPPAARPVPKATAIAPPVPAITSVQPVVIPPPKPQSAAVQKLSTSPARGDFAANYGPRYEVGEQPGEYTQAATDKYTPGTLDEHIAKLQASAKQAGINFRIKEVDRDPKRQDALYAQGRTNPGAIVTNARGGESLHNRHMAFDVEMLDTHGRPTQDPETYKRLGDLAKQQGLIWGGDFVNLKGDMGHIEKPSKVRPPAYNPKPPSMEDVQALDKTLDPFTGAQIEPAEVAREEREERILKGAFGQGSKPTGKEIYEATRENNPINPIMGAVRVAHGAEQYHQSFDPNKNPIDSGSRARIEAGQDIIGGGMQAAGPLMAGAAIKAPLSTAASLAAATGVGYGVEKGAEKLGLSPEASSLAGTAAAALPFGFGIRRGLKGEILPPETRTSAGHNLELPAPQPPTINADPVTEAAAALARKQVAENPSLQPPPPKPAGPETITADHIAQAQQMIDSLPVAERPAATLQAHDALAKWALERGKFVGPDGKVVIVKNQEQAEAFAQRTINDHISQVTKDEAKAARSDKQPSTRPVREKSPTPSSRVDQAQEVAPSGVATVATGQSERTQAGVEADRPTPEFIEAHKEAILRYTKEADKLEMMQKIGMSHGDIALQRRLVRDVDVPSVAQVAWNTQSIRERILRGSTAAPVSGKPSKGMTADTAAVQNVLENANIHPDQQPAVLVKEESPKQAEALAKPPDPVEPAKAAEIGKEDSDSGRTILQPSDDVIENERLAADSAPELATKLSHIAAGVEGATFDRLRPQKELERVDEKVDKADKPPETVADYLAAQIAADSPKAKDDLIAELRKNFPVVKLEDNFLDGKKELANYRSANIQVQTENGSTAEIQIVPREQQEIVNESHVHYSKGREADLAGDTKTRDAEFAKAAEMHDAAMEKFNERNGIGKKDIFDREDRRSTPRRSDTSDMMLNKLHSELRAATDPKERAEIEAAILRETDLGNRDAEAKATENKLAKGSRVSFTDNSGQQRTGELQHINELAARVKADDGSKHEVGPSKVHLSTNSGQSQKADMPVLKSGTNVPDKGTSLAAQGVEATMKEGAKASPALAKLSKEEQIVGATRDVFAQDEMKRQQIEHLQRIAPEAAKEYIAAHPEVQELLAHRAKEGNNNADDRRAGESKVQSTETGRPGAVQEAGRDSTQGRTDGPEPSIERPLHSEASLRKQLKQAAPQIPDEHIDATLELMRQFAENHKGETLDQFIQRNGIEAPTGGKPGEGALAQTQPTFKSKAMEVAEQKLPNAGRSMDFLNTLKNNGVKADEMKWTGLDDFLKSKPKFTKQEVLDHLRENNVQVKEVMKGGTTYAGEEVGALGNAAVEALKRNDMLGFDTAGQALAAVRDHADWRSRWDVQDPQDIETIQRWRDARLSTGGTKFSQHTLPGGSNYRELLLTWPHDFGKLTGYTKENVIPLERGEHPAARSIDFWYFKTPDNVLQIAKSRFPTRAEALEYVIREKQPAPYADNNFRSSHFDEPNVLAHVRFNDRTDAEGKKVLFLEEVQSDWHQKGRRQGYGKDTTGWTAQRLNSPDAGFNHWQVNDADGNRITTIVGGDEQGAIRKAAEGGVPDAPFKKDWHELSLKRMLRYAAENGYDKLAWTPGDVQNDRYDLSKHVDSVEWQPETKELWVRRNGSHEKLSSDVTDKNLADYVGKDVAAKLLDDKSIHPDNATWRTLEGDGLKVGGSGMKGFYDKIIPDFLNKYGKKWGAKVGESEVPSDTPAAAGMRADYDGANNAVQHPNSERWGIKRPDGSIWGSFRSRSEAITEFGHEFGGVTRTAKVPSISITPEMKKSVLEEGQYLFQGPKGAVEFLKDGRTLIHAFESADVSTLAHESAHIFRRNLKEPEMKAAETWLGVKGGKWTEDHEERFARGFEQYLKDGKAPNQKLKDLFAKFKQWLSDIYQKLVPGSPKIDAKAREIFDSILGGKKEPVTTSVESSTMSSRKTISLSQGGEKIGEIAIDRVKDGQANIGWVEVNPDKRGLGFGRKLYERAIEYARENGIHTLNSDTVKVSDDATRVWKSLVRDGVARESAGQTPRFSIDVPAKQADIPAGETGRMNTADIHLDPKRFQYKLNTNERGVTNLLQGRRFNEDLASTVNVWKDPSDGKTYVVNGHHRVELAKSTGHPSMLVRVLDSPDAASARATGALQNIAEGRGTPMDAAKYIRDSKITPEELEREGISMGEATAAQGLALSKLSDHLFDQVVSGKMRPGRGVAIGEATSDPVQQDAIVKLIDKAEAKGRRIPDDVVSELGRMAAQTGTHTESTASLFGNQEETHSLVLEKAEASAYVKQQLSKEKRIFGSVASESKAAELSKAGNKINAAENERISKAAAQAEEVYNKLSTRAGAVNDILETAAARLAKGDNANEVKQQAYDAIRAQVARTFSGTEEVRPEERKADAGRGEGNKDSSDDQGPVNKLFQHGDDDLKPFATARDLRIEEQGEQPGLFGGSEKMYRLSRGNYLDGTAERVLVTESQLDKLADRHPNVRKALRGTEASGQEDLFKQAGFAKAEAVNPIAFAHAAAEKLNSVYDKAVEGLIQNIHMGRSHPEVEKVDADFAKKLREYNALPQYLKAKAQNIVKGITGDLSRDQEKGFVLLADKASRDWLASNENELYQKYYNDPKIVAALDKYRPLEAQLRETQRSLGGAVIEEDYLRRVYDKYVAGVGEGGNTLEKSPKFDRVITPQMANNKGRKADASYYFHNGLHEFGPSFLPRFISTNLKLAEHNLAADFMSKATKLTAKDEMPDFIDYNGKRLYSPEAARLIRESQADSPEGKELAKSLGVEQLPKPKDIQTYQSYSPFTAARMEGSARGLAMSAINGDEQLQGKAHSFLNQMGTRYLGPKEVIDALNSDAKHVVPQWIRDAGQAMAPITGAIRQQLLITGIPHVKNILRRTMQTTNMAQTNPKNWARAWNVAFSKELKERGLKGTDDPSFDALLKHAGISPEGAISFEHYIKTNLDENSWKSLYLGAKDAMSEPGVAGKVRGAAKLAGEAIAAPLRPLNEWWHKKLFEQGGLDQRARLYIYDFVKSQNPKMTDAEIADRLNEQLGRYNKASWTDLQKDAAPFMMFPGWNFGSANWVMRHPLRVVIPAAVIVLLANNIINKAGGNKQKDKFDPNRIHVGGRSFGESLLDEHLGKKNSLVQMPTDYAKGRLQGKSNQEAIGDALQGLQGDAGALVSMANPLVLTPVELAARKRNLVTNEDIFKKGDFNKRGAVLPKAVGGKGSEDFARYFAGKAFPQIDAAYDKQGDTDWMSLVGRNVGNSNFSEKKRKR